ncbi:MAG: hypothetical protein ACOC44_20350 [Promethearchaeia archaeon]
MELNLESLKEYSINFTEELRFPIKFLEISSTNDEWINFDLMEGEFKTPGGRLLSLELRDILLDTGNLTDYSLFPGSYKKCFIKKLNNDFDFEKEKIEGIRGNKIRIEILVDPFDFRFLDTTFVSKIGFRWDIDVENLFTVNIGIKSLSFFPIFFR